MSYSDSFIVKMTNALIAIDTVREGLATIASSILILDPDIFYGLYIFDKIYCIYYPDTNTIIIYEKKFLRRNKTLLNFSFGLNESSNITINNIYLFDLYKNAILLSNITDKLTTLAQDKIEEEELLLNEMTKVWSK